MTGTHSNVDAFSDPVDETFTIEMKGCIHILTYVASGNANTLQTTESIKWYEEKTIDLDMAA